MLAIRLITATGRLGPTDTVKPNGFHGPDDAWERIEAPLRRIDSVLTRFADDHDVVLRKSERNWPSRTLAWNGDLDRMIQVYLEDQESPAYTLWICAKQDRSESRYVRALALMESVPIDDIERRLPELLEASYGLLASWSVDDLEFEVKIPADRD